MLKNEKRKGFWPKSAPVSIVTNLEKYIFCFFWCLPQSYKETIKVTSSEDVKHFYFIVVFLLNHMFLPKNIIFQEWWRHKRSNLKSNNQLFELLTIETYQSNLIKLYWLSRKAQGSISHKVCLMRSYYIIIDVIHHQI